MTRPRWEWWAAPVALVGLVLLPAYVVGKVRARVRPRPARTPRLSETLRAEGVIPEDTGTELDTEWRRAS
jgi:hypothetical protein